MNYQNKEQIYEGRKPRGGSQAKELSIKNVMQTWFDSHEILADFNQEEIIALWEETTGELVKKLTKKIYVKDKVLYVYVNAPALKHELMMIRTDLCDRINQKLNHGRIKSICIK